MKVKIILRIFITFLNLIPGYSLAAVDSQKKITACLIDVYTKQSFYQSKFEKYSSNLEELIKKNSKTCQGVSLSILQASNDDFEISGEFENAKWTVDSDKKFQKIR